MKDKKIRSISLYEYKKTFDLIKRLYETDDVYELTQKIYDDKNIELTTKMNRINCILALNKQKEINIPFDEKLKQIKITRDNIKKEYLKKIQDNNLSKSQQNVMNTISYEKLNELINILNAKKYDSFNDLREYLMIYLIINYPIRNDQKNLLIINNDEQNDKINNFIIINDEKAEIIINYHKTSDYYGPINIILKDEIKNDIQKYLMQTTNKYLFENNNKSLTTQKYSYEIAKIFLKYLNIKINTTVLRKINLSYKYKKIIDELKKDNEMYKNSLSMKISTYINNNIDKVKIID